MTINSKIGLPPGSLIYTGDSAHEGTLVSYLGFDEKEIIYKDLNAATSVIPSLLTMRCNWIRVIGLRDVQRIGKLGTEFNIHPLVIEDILNTNQRPKMEVHADYIFLTMQTLAYDADKSKVSREQVSFVLGKNYVITFQDKSVDVFKPITDRIENAHGRVRNHGNDYLFYALFDSVVDKFYLIADKMGDVIQKLENDVVKNRTRTSEAALKKIMRYRQELLKLRKSISPLRDVFARIEKSGVHLVSEDTLRYMNDIQDHVIQISDTLDTHRETLNNLLEIHLSHSSNRLNQVMKVLTIISTIFIPLTFLAGIYGMNFKNMPELENPYGYPSVIGVMAITVILMLVYFKRKDWL